MIIKFYYAKRGAHWHVRVFTGKSDNMTFASCGELTFSDAEWDDVRNVLQSSVRFIPENTGA